MIGMRHALYRAKYRWGRSLPLSSPVDVSLELASRCNMRCDYCYHSDPKNLPFERGLMPSETAYKIIRQSAACGVNSLKFNYRGESTLHPDYAKITKFAYDLSGGSTFIDRLANSNFKFKTDRDDIFQGLSYLTKVKISYDSFIKEVFETQRAGGKHDVTTRNIDKFYNLPGRTTTMVIQAVRTKLNRDEDIEHSVKRRWPEAEVSIRDMVAGRVDKSLDDLEIKERDISSRKPCQQAFVRLLFDIYGIATACCPDINGILRLGDIHEDFLTDIFNSYAAKELRRQLKNKSAFTSDPCKNCSSFESYKGFRPNWDS